MDEMTQAMLNRYRNVKKATGDYNKAAEMDKKEDISNKTADLMNAIFVSYVDLKEMYDNDEFTDEQAQNIARFFRLATDDFERKKNKENFS